MNCGLPERDAVQPLGQPDVNVQGHRRRGQGGHGPVVERDGVPAQALEVFLAQPDRGGPQHPLIGLLGEPQVEGA